MSKLTITEVIKLFSKRNFRLITKEYKNNKQKLKYICNKGHIAESTVTNLKAGKGCAECSGNKRKTFSDVKLEFIKNNYTLISKEVDYHNTDTKLKYICRNGHKAEISFTNLRLCKGCKICSITLNAKNRRQFDLNSVKDYLANNDYKLITENYVNCEQRLTCLCPNNHKCEISIYTFKKGHRCKYCAAKEKAEKIRYSYDFIKSQFDNRGFELIEKTYENNQQRLKYICDKGHKQTIQYANFRLGKGCKICSIDAMRGENHHNYNPDLTDDERGARRITDEYRKWRIDVYRRDKFKCKCCNKKSNGDLVAHHIFSFKDNVELRTDINNGVTLCRGCHLTFHKTYGFGNNNSEQLNEFKANQQATDRLILN